MRRVCLVLSTAFALLAGLAPAASAALPFETVSCGEVLDRSVRISNSLFGCDLHGLVIARDGITIDLNGNSIAGDDVNDDPNLVESGVFCDSCRDVVIRNGSLHRFDSGVTLGQNSRRVTVSGVRAVDNILVGIRVVGIGHKVKRSLASENGAGITVLGTRHTFTGNRALDNQFDGFDIVGPTSTFLRNESARNGDDGFATLGGGGHVYKENLARDNVASGFEIAATKQTLIGNRAQGNSTGFSIAGSEHELSGNHATDGGFDGFNITGTEVASAGDRASGNGRIGFIVAGQDNVIRDARGTGNIDDGIFVSGSGNEVRGSVATGNGLNGVHVASGTTHIVSGAVANSNGFLNGASDGNGLGIRVDPGSLVAKNNRAKGNDNGAECSALAKCNQ